MKLKTVNCIFKVQSDGEEAGPLQSLLKDYLTNELEFIQSAKTDAWEGKRPRVFLKTIRQT